jgi:hypothetical protein
MFLQSNRLSKNIAVFSCAVFSCAVIADTDLDTSLTIQNSESIYQLSTSNSIWEDKEIAPEFYESPYQVSLFSPQNGEDADRVISQTETVIASGLGIVAILGTMPSSVTNWEEDDENDLSTKWSDNISYGPVWDRDDWYLNYLAHPYFGGVFYQSARKSGYRQWDSFIYSFMMSTFYWEYGIEAFAEKPSIQDLVITPTLGWLYGEWAFNTERDIWLNGGTVLGSEILGNISLFFLDPIDSIGRNLNYLFGEDILKAGTGYLTFQQEANSPFSEKTEAQIGLNVRYRFGGHDSNVQTGINSKTKRYSLYRSNHLDPVDTGIVGFSVGGVWVDLDSKWGVKQLYAKQASLGLYFTRHFSTRLNYCRAEDVEKQDTQSNITYENYGLDMQYYFNSQANLRPFITTGIGEVIFDKDREQKFVQVNAGVGLHYKINNNWSVQTDWHHYYSTVTETNDDQLGAAIIYRFGKGEWSL